MGCLEKGNRMSKFIIVHRNPEGFPFVSRVEAEDIEEAKEAVKARHGDNEVEDAMEDHGEAVHGVGGSILPIQNLNEEP